MSESMGKKDGLCYFCPNCGNTLNFQTGFDAGRGYWTCEKCGKLLVSEKYAGKRFPDVMWVCDNCGALLNEQKGFDDNLETWICTECGYREDFSLVIESCKEKPFAQKNSFRKKVALALEKSKPTIIKAAKYAVAGVTILGGIAVVLAQRAKNADKESAADNPDIQKSESHCDRDEDIIASEPEAAEPPHYRVEYKAFKTGQWYTKTETDNIGGAYSVMGGHNTYGRACRLIDTHTGKILKEVEEDPSMAACNGYPNGYPW